ncbi:hypothetical protein V8E54_014087 [Elaphomyces granulatus]|jgi:hypothetical protein
MEFMAFMAIEVLLGYSHTYRHNLEAFFYVLLIWQCARRLGCEEWPKHTLLTQWYTGSYIEIANAEFGKSENAGLHSRTFWMNSLPRLIVSNPSAELYETLVLFSYE